MSDDARRAAGEVSLEIAKHAKFGVGSAAPCLDGLQVLVNRHGASAENFIPGLLCACAVDDIEVYDAAMTGALMILAALRAVEPGGELSGTAREHVHAHADAVLSALNRVGERIMSREAVSRQSHRIPGGAPKKRGGAGAH